MKNKKIRYILIMVFSIVAVNISSFAQRDSLKKKTVDITSVFKPALKESAKINFTASPAANDTTIQKLNYSIPNQNLLFNYQPTNIKPLALFINSGGHWPLSNFIKIGYGNLKTPVLHAGFSFGDGFSKGMNIYAKHISSKEKNNLQNFSKTNFDLVGFYQTENKLEWNSKLGVNIDKYYIDGEIIGLLKYVQQQFQSVTAAVGFRNLSPSKFGLIYSPELEVNIFKDKHLESSSEQSIKLNLPLQKNVGKLFAVHLAGNFNFSNYAKITLPNTTNTVFGLSASAHLKTPKLNLRIGVRPTWDNSTLKVFPDITAEVSTEDSRFVFQAGWVGAVQQVTYQYLVSQNQWIKSPVFLKNTWREERYAGFKGSIGNHFNYSTKIGFHKFKNHPLYFQQYWFGWPLPLFWLEPFTVQYEPELKALNFTAEFGYTVHEKLSILTSFVYNQYSLKNNPKPFGLVPIELKTAVRYQLLNDLWLKSDLFAWGSSYYIQPSVGPTKMPGAIDFNMGIEYRIAKKINLWTQFNNILNKEYQRWNLFPSYGFNFAGGVIFSFDKTRK